MPQKLCCHLAKESPYQIHIVGGALINEGNYASATEGEGVIFGILGYTYLWQVSLEKNKRTV